MSPMLMPLVTSMAPKLAQIAPHFAPELLQMGRQQINFLHNHVNNIEKNYIAPLVQPGLQAAGQGIAGLLQKILPQPTRPFSY